MAGKLVFTLEQYQEAAVKYRKELLMLPIFGSMDTLKHMTGRPGIRYKERVGTMDFDAQFGPYKPQRRSNNNLKLDFRTLETYFGSVVANFHPNSAVSTLLGAIGATKGDGQMQTPTAKHVLALIAKSLSESLNNAIWAAKRNANGDTTNDLFDGFDTITENDIRDGKIAREEGNYLKITDAVIHRVFHVLKADRLPLEQDLPGIRLVDAEDCLRELGAAGAEKARDAEDLARADREAAVLVTVL